MESGFRYLVELIWTDRVVKQSDQEILDSLQTTRLTKVGSTKKVDILLEPSKEVQHFKLRTFDGHLVDANYTLGVKFSNSNFRTKASKPKLSNQKLRIQTLF